MSPRGGPTPIVTPKEEPATPAQLATKISPEVATAYAADKDVAMVPLSIFRREVDSTLSFEVRPPTKKMLGTKLRESKFIPTTPEVLQEVLATKHGLPQEDKDSKIEVRSRPATSQPRCTYHTARAPPLHDVAQLRAGRRDCRTDLPPLAHTSVRAPSPLG